MHVLADECVVKPQSKVLSQVPGNGMCHSVCFPGLGGEVICLYGAGDYEDSATGHGGDASLGMCQVDVVNGGRADETLVA